MRITILGASGKVGFRLTKLLLEHDHEVNALVHNKDLPGLESSKLHIIKGNIHNKTDIEKALTGSTVVVSTLGSWGTKTKDIVSSATKNLIPAMQAASIKRFVSVTGGAAHLPHETESISRKITRLMLGLVAKPILADAEEHLRLLSKSALEWTALRCPVMTNKQSTSYKLSLIPPSPLANISRQAVVLALLETIEKDNFNKQAPFISAK